MLATGSQFDINRNLRWPGRYGPADKFAMIGLGERMRERARELGWPDAEVARRLGIAQTRYANYITDRHEPDLATFVRICAVLGVSPDALLAVGREETEEGRLRNRISAAASGMERPALDAVMTIADALVAKQRPPGR